MTRTAAVNLVYFSSLILLVGVPATLTPIFYDEAQNVIQDLLDLSTQLGDYAFATRAVRRAGLSSGSLGAKPVPSAGCVFDPSARGGAAIARNHLGGRVVVSDHPGQCVFVFIRMAAHARKDVFLRSCRRTAPKCEELYERIRRIWMAYLRGQIVLMVIVGVVFTIVWLFMGIPGALVLGVLAGLFTLVPDVGPFIAVTLAAGVALLEGSTWGPLAGLPNFWVAGIVLVTYLILINLKNFFLRPIIMGRSVHMNEGLVFIVILIATILEGILGALLVVPVLASVVVIAGYIQRKVLGLPAFEDDGSMQFVAPPEDQSARGASGRGRQRQEYR